MLQLKGDFRAVAAVYCSNELVWKITMRFSLPNVKTKARWEHLGYPKFHSFFHCYQSQNWFLLSLEICVLYWREPLLVYFCWAYAGKLIRNPRTAILEMIGRFRRLAITYYSLQHEDCIVGQRSILGSRLESSSKRYTFQVWTYLHPKLSASPAA